MHQPRRGEAGWRSRYSCCLAASTASSQRSGLGSGWGSGRALAFVNEGVSLTVQSHGVKEKLTKGVILIVARRFFVSARIPRATGETEVGLLALITTW